MIFIETAAFISFKYIQGPLLNCEISFSIAKKKNIEKSLLGAFLNNSA